MEVEPQSHNIQNQADLLNQENYVGLNLEKKVPSTLLTFAGMKAGNNWLKYLKWLYKIGICSLLSLGHGVLTVSQGVQHLECYPVTDSWQAPNVPRIKQCVSHTVLSVPQFPGNSVFPCWRNVFKTVIPGASQTRHTGVSTPVTSSIFVPQQSAWPSPFVSHSLETDSKHGMFLRQEFSLYLVLCGNKLGLDQVPPLEQSHFSPMVRVHP